MIQLTLQSIESAIQLAQQTARPDTHRATFVTQDYKSCWPHRWPKLSGERLQVGFCRVDYSVSHWIVIPEVGGSSPLIHPLFQIVKARGTFLFRGLFSSGDVGLDSRAGVA